MTHVRTVMLLGICFSIVSLVAHPDETNAIGSQQLTPKAAQQYAADSEKAAGGDPDAAYRMGEAFESGRLGGAKDLNKALTYYKQAAQKGHKEAAARAMQLEVELGKAEKKASPPSAH